MRLRWAAATCGLGVACACTAVVAAASTGRSTADDLEIAVGLEFVDSASPGVTKGLDFRIFVLVSSASGIEQDITVRIELPSGLRWGTDGPDPTEGCSGTAPATCTGHIVRNPVGTVEGGWVWDVVAERAGTYAITASVDANEPDPDPSNNRFAYRVEVRQPTAGGGGRTGGSAVVASAVRTSPTRPRAGTTVTAAVRVSAGGVAVRPTRVSCTATIGRAKVAGAPSAQPGAAVCRYRTPRAAKGATLRGAVAFTARGTRMTRRFAVALR
jgi:hypothetical protein